MARAPKNVPAEGDRVIYKKDDSAGVIEWCNSANWCKVQWDKSGPGIVHLFELKKE